MQNAKPLQRTFFVEIVLLALAFPILYFPKYFPDWLVFGGFAALAAGWLWRRWQLGIWRVATPLDLPLFLLFFVMLPISIWAAPEPLRQQYSLPRAYILIWNFCLFWIVVTYGSLDWKLLKLSLIGFITAGTAIALVAPLGTNWLYKFPLFDPILRIIPSPLIGVFQGADSGFHPNQVAGTLLYVLPLMIALTVGGGRRRTWMWWLLAGGTALVSVSFLMMQSRSGVMGLGVGILTMVLMPSRRGQWVLLFITIVALMTIVLFSNSILAVIGDSPPAEALGGTGTIGFRQEVWKTAVQGIYDFPFTGMGLGTFRQVGRLLYPVTINPDYDIGHAHNIFLQNALDFGIPGLVAIIALYLVTFYRLGGSLERSIETKTNFHQNSSFALTLGLLSSLVTQIVYSQLDLVAMGAKTNLLFWWLLGTSMSNLVFRNLPFSDP